jgi:hypothetical protein
MDSTEVRLQTTKADPKQVSTGSDSDRVLQAFSSMNPGSSLKRLCRFAFGVINWQK